MAANRSDKYRHFEPEDATIKTLNRRVERAVLRARSAIFWEQLWPILARVAMVIALFLGLSWCGVWTAVSDWIRIPAVALIGIALIYALLPLRKLVWPSPEEGERRIERVSGYRHRPLETLTDELAVGDRSPASQALWAAHKARVADSVRRLAAGIPSPGFYKRDPYALRVVVAVVFVVGFFASSGQRGDLLKSAFVSQKKETVIAGRLDAWIAPPRYTNRAPVFLTGESKPAETVAPGAKPPAVKVPINSELIVRANGIANLKISLGKGADATEILPVGAKKDEADESKKADKPATPSVSSTSPSEYRHKLAAGGLLVIAGTGRDGNQWQIEIEADDPPAISLVGKPKPDISGTMNYTYAMTDDYGIASAMAEMALDQPPTASKRKTRPLFDAPAFPLVLPSGRGRTGEASTRRDLSAHPWAGSSVKLTLKATDVAGQEAKSAAVAFSLPMREFGNPVARAIIEQRRNLALNANSRDEVIEAVSALMIAPDKFLANPGHFLAIRHAFSKLLASETDDQLRDVVATLWDLALFLEDGDLSLAAQALRKAQEALRDALERGASDEEIRKLTQQLREALNRYMQALAEQARRNPNARNMPIDPNMRMLRSEDLQKMLDRLEDLARSGSRDAARELLSQLQQMLENLQTGRMQQQQRGNNPMMQMLDELGDIIRRQQKLMDQTHRQGQNQQQGRQGQMSPSERARRDRMMRSLRRGQGDLRQSLEDLMRQLRQFGMQPGKEMGRAGREMEGAEGELGKGRSGRAVGRQGEALRALRQGAEGMMRQMMGMRGQGNQRAFGQPNSRRTDPLGRPNRNPTADFGDHVKVPDEIDAQRARRILEELRRRLSDPNRRALEKDYLERLLKRY